MKKFIHAFVVGLLASLGLGTAMGAPESKAQDIVFITAVSPATWPEDEEIEVEVEVAYVLASREAARLEIGGNLRRPGAVEPLTSVDIEGGQGQQKLRAKVRARRWGARNPFHVNAFLSARDEGSDHPRILAADQIKVPVSPRAPTNDAPRKTPDAKDVFEDGLVITAVAPRMLKAGVEQEVVVTVKYDLLSRSQGEINLGANQGRAQGYTILKTVQISQGAGEVQVRLKLTPRKTAGLPFFRLHANMSEFPHPRSWSPLANDMVTLELE